MSKSENEAMSRSERKKQDKRNKNDNNKAKKKMSLWKRILLWIVGIVLAIGIGGLGLFAYYASNSPELTEEDLTGAYSSDLVDMNGNVFYSLGAEERNYASASDYPEVMLDAIKSIEDQRFDSHIGIDPIGIGRAAVGYLTNSGEIVGGGSTITQQLVKLSVFTTSTTEAAQTLERKAQEAWLAMQLERQLSKEQIITLYLNKVHMGGNVYGVATAAEEYYDKDISEVELHEAALLAAMPNAPNYYNPYNNPEAATQRRNLVLDQMVRYDYITETQAQEAKEVSVEEGLIERKTSGNNLVFDSYLSAVIDEVREKTDYNPYTAGLTIYTNYDPEAQKIMFDVVNSEDYVDFPDDEIQTAASLIDSTSGRVTALIGGRKFEDQLSMNRATTQQRNIGSTIKPLTVYGPAIEYEQYSTYHQIVDEPYTVGDWSPRNYDRQHRGQISMREALVDSRNIPAAKVFNEDLDQSEVAEFLGKIGIDASTIAPGSDGLVPSNAISGTMTPLELAGAFSAFANSGTFIEPYLVSTIITQDGEEIDLVPSENKAMEDYTAYMMNDMLKDVVSTHSDLNIPGYVHAAKTGTTNYTEEQLQESSVPSGGVPDSWLVGYSPYYTMSVWVGYDQPLEEGNFLTFDDGTRQIPWHIYREAISNITSGLETRDWSRPNSVVEASIENGSNPAQLAPSGSSNAVSELFVRGTEPTDYAEPLYELTAPTGLSAEYLADTDEVSISWNAFELPDEVDEDVEYVLTVNGEEHVLSDTGYTVSSPTSDSLDITVAVRVAGDTGPTASLTFTIPEEPEEPEEPDEPDEPEEPEEPDEPDESEDPDNNNEPEDPDESSDSGGENNSDNSS